MAYPMGESKQPCLRVDFDRRLRLEFHGSTITTGAGFLAYRELDDALELTEMAGDVFCDNRTGKNAPPSRPRARENSVASSVLPLAASMDTY